MTQDRAFELTKDLDDEDRTILVSRNGRARERFGSPLCGDYLRFSDGSIQRIAHVWHPKDWDTNPGVQPTCERFGSGRFHLDADGLLDYSGALDPIIPWNRLVRTTEIVPAHCWFFHHAWMKAHNGVDVACEVQVWDVLDVAPDGVPENDFVLDLGVYS